MLKYGVSVVGVKASPVYDWPIPKILHNVKGFLGLTNFFQLFIWSFVNILGLLTSLTKKEYVFEWTELC